MNDTRVFNERGLIGIINENGFMIGVGSIQV